jgi:hypothetical protein
MMRLRLGNAVRVARYRGLFGDQQALAGDAFLKFDVLAGDR